MKETRIRHLISFFEAKTRFSREQLHQYFLNTEGGVTESTLGWRIHELKQENVIQEIKTGWYTLVVKPVYAPTPDKRIIRIDKTIKDKFQEVQYCVWNIDWLNEFTLHQFNRDTFIVEIEKDLQRSLEVALHEKGFKDILPARWLPNLPLSFVDAVNPIFSFPLISRAPLQQIAIGKNRSVSYPTLEKILVDIFRDNQIFHFVQGDLEKIFEDALNRYAINFTTLFGYAKRRNKEADLRAYLNDNFPKLLENTNG